MNDYRLHEVAREAPLDIRSEWRMVDQDQTGGTKVLVLSIHGTYPPGSRGSAHGRFIAQEALAAVHVTSPHCLVLDLRELDYVWGDTMLGVFQDVSQFMDGDVPRGAPAFPVVVAVSERSNGIRSLFGGPSAVLFTELASAIGRAIELGATWEAW